MSKVRIADVVEHVRSAVSEQEKTAGDHTEETSREFHSKLAEGLHKCAQVLRARADAPVTYDEVLSLGRRVLEQD